MGTTPVPAWNVPLRRNPFFTGREPVFTQIYNLLHAGKAAALSQPPAISRVLAIIEKVLGPEHSDTAKALNNLALVYHDQGKHEGVEIRCKSTPTIEGGL